MARAKKGEEKGFAKSFLEGLPLLGDLVKELSKTETFKKKFEDVDKQIEENLRKGEKKRWGFEANVSVRPIIEDAKREGGELFIGNDYLCGMKGDKLILAVKTPLEEVKLELKGKTLKLRAKDWKKLIDLPDKFSRITDIKYKNGVLMLELVK